MLVPTGGLFASGKFDQYKRDIPYATLAQAFDGLVRPLLSKTEAELNEWRITLREALGPNGQLIVDLVPELELSIGKQIPIPVLPPRDAQRRFQLVVRRFILNLVVNAVQAMSDLTEGPRRPDVISVMALPSPYQSGNKEGYHFGSHKSSEVLVTVQDSGRGSKP